MPTKTLADILSTLSKEVLGQFDFSNAVYRGSSVPIEGILCSTHGSFRQYPAQLRKPQGARCPACANEKRGNDRRMPLDEFVARCQKVHETRGYGYSLVNYRSMHDKIDLVCPMHGSFQIKALKHLYAGQGCAACENEAKKTRILKYRHLSPAANKANFTASFLDNVRAVHGDKYDYADTVYIGRRKPITVRCRKHGEFVQQACHHMSGQGCPSCGQRSAPEEEVVTFLEGLGVNLTRRDRTIIRPKELDIVLPDQKLAIEYCGLYWHSEAGGKTKASHLEKHLLCEAAGYRLITVFDDEWMAQRSKVESTLRHFVGLSPKGVYGRMASIAEIKWSQAAAFLERHHLLGTGSAATVCVGAHDRSGQLIAVMSFGPPSDERGATGEIEMKRYVSDGRNHPGLGSRMFRWSIETYGWTKVSAFVDRRWFGGSFKLHSGFKRVGESEPSLFWTIRRERFHRRAFKKAELTAKHGPGLSKHEMMKRDGYSRIWDCGKLKFEWAKE